MIVSRACVGVPRQDLVDDGYAATQILAQLHESVVEGDLGDKQKSAIAEKMAVGTCRNSRSEGLAGRSLVPAGKIKAAPLPLASGCEQVSGRRG